MNGGFVCGYTDVPDNYSQQFRNYQWGGFSGIVQHIKKVKMPSRSVSVSNFGEFGVVLDLFAAAGLSGIVYASLGYENLKKLRVILS